jgi:hypothetical protein
MTIEHILFEPYASYEEFHQQIDKLSKSKNKFLLKKLIDTLINTPQKQIDIIRREILSGSLQPYFFINVFWLYRWVISAGFEIMDSDAVNKFFCFLKKIGAPGYVIKQNKWAFPLMKRNHPDENFWKDRILTRFVKKFDKDSLFSEVINLWLLYHIGLKQLFPESEPGGKKSKPGSKKMTDTMEIVLTNYLKLIDEFSELEDIFGVTIEKDLFRVYKIFGGIKNEE